MKIKAWFKDLFETLGITEKAKTGSFSPEEIEKINAACKEKFQLDFAATLTKMQEEDEHVTALEDGHKAILAAIYAPNAQAAQAAAAAAPAAAAPAAAAVAAAKQTVEDLTAQNQELAAQAEPSKPKSMQAKMTLVSVKGGAHTEKHLFGIEAPFFAIEKPWNAVAATRQPLEIIAATRGLQSDWNDYEASFKEEINKYGKSLANRINQLQGEGNLSNIKMQDIDFTGFDGTGWGETYIVRRQDALIAYIRQLNSVGRIFTTRYGVQNKESLTNSFLTNFSASFQTGRYFKGKVAVQAVEAQVYDVMIKHKFTNLKDLEKEYIGYLNKEGSDPMKWTWIEWVMARILEVAMNEWNERRIIGQRIEPTAGTLGHHLHGSDGVLRQLWKWAEEFRLKPISDYDYTKSTILTSVEGFVEFVYGKIPSLKGLTLYMNEKHIPWYNQAYRKEYSLQQDFTGPKSLVMNYPDVNIVGVPNMGNSTMMILTVPGNIELIENQAGEMAKIGMQRDLEELMVFSYWKEGVTAYMVGKKFASAAALDADDYANQFIFFTDDTIAVDADATTMNATKGTRFLTAENSGATVITDITGAKPGVVYRITCGSMTNASEIAKSGKFSAVDAWDPAEVNNYIEVYLHQNLDDTTDVLNGKFIEVTRYPAAQ